MKTTTTSSAILLAAFAVAAGIARANAAVKDWKSQLGGNWSDNSNWAGVINFSEGDGARFPAGGTVSTINFDLDPGTDVDGIIFQAGSWRIQGNTMDLKTGITNAGNNEVLCLIQIFPNVTFSSSSGRLTLGSVSLLGRTATFSVNTGATIVPGVITGTGTASRIVKTGPGSLVMNSASTYQGTTTVQAGALEGTGTIPNVVLAGGTLSPGAGVNPNATITVTGLAATSASVLKMGLLADQDGHLTDQDQVVLTGAADLKNITLDLDYNRPIGAADFVKREIILISKTSSGFVSGTFAGLPEGAPVSIEGVAMEVSYSGGMGGNDVVLRPRTQPATLTWKLSNSSVWSRAISWSGFGPVEPAAGDNLVFPDLTGLEHHPEARNDLAGAVIGSITINSNNYSIGGGSFRLRTGITMNDFPPRNTVGLFNSVAGVTADSAIFIRNHHSSGGMLLAVLGINANNQTITVDGTGIANTRVSFQPGGGSIIKDGTVLVDLFDSTAFTGPITVNQGTMRVFGSLGTADTGTTINAGGTVQIGGSVAEPFTLNGGTLATSDGTAVTYTGAISTTAPGSALRAAIAPQDNIAEFATTVDTTISGTGGLRLINGTALFQKPTTFTGPMLIQNGYAVFLSTHTSSPIIAGTAAGVATNSGPFVMGTGTVAAVTINDGARLDPGSLLRTVGTLTIAGSLNIGAAGNYFPTMDTNSADRVVVTGTVTANGRLRPVVTKNFSGSLNATFVIIDNDGTDPVIGRFIGSGPNGAAEATLDEGALVVGINPEQTSTPIFRVSYMGGTGNDVTLTLVSN